MLNFAHAPMKYALGDESAARVVLTTFLDREGERVEGYLALRADEGVLLELGPAPARSRAA